GLLFRVVGDSNHDFIEHPAGPFDQIGVAVGDGIEGARVDDFWHAQLLLLVAGSIAVLFFVLSSGDFGNGYFYQELVARAGGGRSGDAASTSRCAAVVPSMALMPADSQAPARAPVLPAALP